MPNCRRAPPTAGEVHEATLAAARGNASCSQCNPDCTYKNEWKKFTRWIDTYRNANMLPPGDEYLTRENVDIYFAQFVASHLIQPSGARHVVSTLQWYSDCREETIGREKFQVKSPILTDSLSSQKEHYENNNQKASTDPYTDVPTTLSKEEIQLAMRAAL